MHGRAYIMSRAEFTAELNYGRIVKAKLLQSVCFLRTSKKLCQKRNSNLFSLWRSVGFFFHRRTLNKCSQKIGFIRKAFDTQISETTQNETVELKRTV